MLVSKKILGVIGTMSGTSFDGVNAAYLRTDGTKVQKIGRGVYIPYKKSLRDGVSRLISSPRCADLDLLLEVADALTLVHAEAVFEVLAKNLLAAERVSLIGFHGQTIYHNDQARRTLQIGNAPLLQKMAGIKVVHDLRRQNIAEGGRGAPLVGIFHKILCESAGIESPVAVLNIGGVSNITYIDKRGKLLAFDVGPGCALINDLMMSKLNKPYDKDGKLASTGKIHENLVNDFMNVTEFFSQKPPKSLDRNEFVSFVKTVGKLELADALATSTFFTAAGIIAAKKFLPDEPKQWFVCGGGRHNKFLMQLLAVQLPVKPIEAISFGKTRVDGDFIEAQAFGVLAARSHFGLPLT